MQPQFTEVMKGQEECAGFPGLVKEAGPGIGFAWPGISVNQVKGGGVDGWVFFLTTVKEIGLHQCCVHPAFHVKGPGLVQQQGVLLLNT